MTTNRALAERASAIAAAADRASVERRGALCASVVLSTTSTPAAARRALVDADLPDPVRAAAAEVLAGLTASLVTGAVTSRVTTTGAAAGAGLTMPGPQDIQPGADRGLRDCIDSDAC